jgi:hypothetical protein
MVQDNPCKSTVDKVLGEKATRAVDSYSCAKTNEVVDILGVSEITSYSRASY